LVGKPERKRHWEALDTDGKMDLSEVGWDGMNWVHLALDRDQWRAPGCKVMKFRVPKNVGNFLGTYATGGFSRRLGSKELVGWRVTGQRI
jgi:hypothetical protein